MTTIIMSTLTNFYNAKYPVVDHILASNGRILWFFYVLIITARQLSGLSYIAVRDTFFSHATVLDLSRPFRFIVHHIVCRQLLRRRTSSYVVQFFFGSEFANFGDSCVGISDARAVAKIGDEPGLTPSDV